MVGKKRLVTGARYHCSGERKLNGRIDVMQFNVLDSPEIEKKYSQQVKASNLCEISKGGLSGNKSLAHSAGFCFYPTTSSSLVIVR